MLNKTKDGKTIIEEVDYAIEFQNLISTNEDVNVDEELLNLIFESKKYELLKVVKTIGSTIEIISVDKFDEVFLAKNF